MHALGGRGAEGEGNVERVQMQWSRHHSADVAQSSWKDEENDAQEWQWQEVRHVMSRQVVEHHRKTGKEVQPWQADNLTLSGVQETPRKATRGEEVLEAGS